MTILDKKGGLTKAMAIALDVGFDLGLNDETAWKPQNERDREHRCLKWLTLCYMERRVALRYKRPISTRAVDVLVNGFSLTCWKHLTDQQLPGAAMKKNELLMKWPLPAHRSERWLQYVQFLSQWCELVTSVWEDIFSLRASKLPSLQKIMMADTSLMHLEASLPTGLQWNSTCLPLSLSRGDLDRDLRLQLIACEVRALQLLLSSITNIAIGNQYGSASVTFTARS